MTYKKGKTTRNSKKLRGSKRRYKGGDPEPGAQAGSETAAEPKTWSSWFWGTSKAVGNSTAKTAENTTLLGMFYKMIKPKESEETKKTEESKTQEPKESETSETNIDVQKDPPVNPDQSPQAPPVDTQSTENSKTTEEPPKTGGRRRKKRKTTKRK